MSVNTNVIKNKNAHVKTFTFEVQPHNVKLLDHLMDQYVLPILRRNTEVNLAQGAVRGKASSKQTPEQELEAAINFGRPEKQHITIPLRTVNVAQGGLTSKQLQDLDKILSFASSSKRNKRE